MPSTAPPCSTSSPTSQASPPGVTCASRRGPSSSWPATGERSLALVGAEAPEVALGVAHGEAPAAVVLVAQRPHERGTGGGRPLAEGIRLVGDDVDARRSRRPARELAGALDERTEHDAA